MKGRADGQTDGLIDRAMDGIRVRRRGFGDGVVK